jgi:hypothetical protein
MSLVWVLFGSECDYYKGLRNVYGTLEMKEVIALKANFSAEHCHRITWAMIDDRSYFDGVKTILDFDGPDSVVFQQSYVPVII